MKHKAVSIVCAVIVVSLVVLVAASWKTEQAQMARAYVAQQAREHRRAETVKANYDKANAECKDGQKAYDGQSVAYHKANPERPVCDLQLVD